MKLIEVTDATDHLKKEFVNIDSINRIESFSEQIYDYGERELTFLERIFGCSGSLVKLKSRKIEGSIIFLTNGKTYVKETLEEIKLMIERL